MKTSDQITSVPFYRMKFTAREVRAVTDVIRSGWLTTGQVAAEFERRVAQYVGARQAVAVNSCTSGLFLALKVLGLGEDPADEVITTPYTMVASSEVILHAGAVPVYADLDPQTLNLDPEQVESKITPRTKAILLVHIAGLPCRVAAFEALAARHGLKLVHDAAHALGAACGGRRIGGVGDITSFSFYATKNVTTAEGGMITLNEDASAEKLRSLSLHGMDKAAWRRYLDRGNWYYEVTALGYKCNLADLNAALGLAQMDRLDKLQARRSQVAAWYDRALSRYQEITLPAREPETTHAWHLYIIQVDTGRLSISRDQFITELASRGIGCSVHFIPLFLHPYYRGKFGLEEGRFPGAAEAYRRVISLPFYPDLSRAEVNYVADSIGQILARVGRR